MVNPIHDFKSKMNQRDSWQSYVKDHAESAKKLHEAEENFATVFADPGTGDFATALQEVKDNYDKARDSFKEHATLTKDGWVKKESASRETFEDAEKIFKEETTKLENFLSGKTKHTLKGTNGAKDIEVGVSDELKKAYEKARAATSKVGGVMDHMFGMWKVEGFSETVKHNVKGLQFWDKDIAKGRAFEITGRSLSVVAGGTMIVDSLARGKNKDEETRSVAGRIIEGATGVLVAGAGLTLGHAR